MGLASPSEHMALYGSKAVPQRVFGNDLAMANAAIYNAFPGPTALRDYLLTIWDSTKNELSWFMPDGFLVRIPVIEGVVYSLRADKDPSGKKWVNQMISERTPKEFSVELCAHIAHAMDAYVCRTVVALCKDIEVLPIHDCFMTHPNNMGQVREAYKKALCLIETERVIERIINQLLGRDQFAECPELAYFHQGHSLVNDIMESEFAIN